MSLKEKLFCIAHPITTIKSTLRQIEVGIEEAGPPAGSTIEDFLELSIFQATQVLLEAKKQEKKQKLSQSNICLEDWSEDDQKRILRGEKPKGVPQHRNL